MSRKPEMAGRLPFNPNNYGSTVESRGTIVFLPTLDSGLSEVVKIPRDSQRYDDLDVALGFVVTQRNAEMLLRETAGPVTKQAVVPQTYVLADGVEPNSCRVVRVQEYVDGRPLKHVGFGGIMRMDLSDLGTLKTILKDSIRCYLKHGVNYDLVGSGSQGILESNIWLNIKKLTFPLRSSSNLFMTDTGIKLVDPSVCENKGDMRSVVGQGLLFVSSVFDYLLLATVISMKK